MTTLQLAQACAEAARQPAGGHPAEAILDVLHDTGHWFCRLSADDGDGAETTWTPLPPVPKDQLLPFE
jgi:hypothetical protein